MTPLCRVEEEVWDEHMVGELSVVPTLTDFKSQLDLFTEGQLKWLNWDNIFVAGGVTSSLYCR
jgi:hypothetical protein